ncbi:MAG: FAD-dependent thymidylate synthase [Thermodesulfobacteriota bacterium]
MKLIEPSYIIFKVHGAKDPLTNIGRCLQSLRGSTEDMDRKAVLSFLQEYIREEEEQYLELGNLAFSIWLDSESPMLKLFERQAGGLNVDRIEKKRYILSGNLRTLRDLCRAHRDLKIVKALLGLLLKDYEPLLADIISKYRPLPLEGVIVHYASDQELEELPLAFRIKHHYLAVHLKASLGAIHELITGCRVSSYILQKQIKTDGMQGLCFIRPPGYPSEGIRHEMWMQAVSAAEKAFLALTDPQNASENQGVLPLALKADLIINTNLLEWIQIFKFGIKKGISPDMRGLILSVFKEVKQASPDLLENIRLPVEA